MFMISLTIELVVPFGLYKCGYLHLMYFYSKNYFMLI